MSNEASTVAHRAVVGLDNIPARLEIDRIAGAVVKQTMGTEEMMAECVKIAEVHYVTIGEVYMKVWAKAEKHPDLHPTHPSGKSKTFHRLRELATR